MWLKSRKKIFVGMSGGVDSSVVALLLKYAANPVEFFKLTGRPIPMGFRGFDVYGGFIRGYNVDGCQDKDLEDARAVAGHIGIPFHIFDFEKEYKERVVDYFIEGYRKGITPNPDVLCNSAIKFGLFYDVAMAAGADYVATGHYARKGRGLWRKGKIFEAKDKNKDQTYFLWQVPKNRFEKVLFPLGRLLKSEVRDIARKANLPVAEKKDSQGVCFLGKFDFDEFLKKHIPVKKGNMIDGDGKKVGEHDGVWFYTIGQGHGFTNTAGKKFYVVKKNLEKNELIVAYENDKTLYSQEVELVDLNFLDDMFEKTFKKGKAVSVFARVRYRQPLTSAVLVSSNAGGKLGFDIPQKLFPASGQSAVFYNTKGEMLGGGIIK